MQRSFPSHGGQPQPTGTALAGSRRPGRTGVLLAAAIAASLLLPLSGGAPTTVSAATPSSTAGLAARAAESPDGLTHLALTPGESEARYVVTVRELGSTKTAACITRAVTGEIVMAPDGSTVPELSKIVIDQRTLKCQAPLSDTRTQNLLQTAQYPLAELTVKSVPGLGVPLPTGDVAFQLVGDQSVHGVSQPTTYDGTANLTPDTMVGQAQTTLKMTSFGMTPTNILGVIQVADDMLAQVAIKATISGPTATAAPAPGGPAAGEAPSGDDPTAPSETTP